MIPSSIKLKFLFEVHSSGWNFLLLNLFFRLYILFPCMPALFSVILVPWACNFSWTLLSMSDTVEPLSRKAYVFSRLRPLLIERVTIWRKLETSLMWFIVAARTLSAWLPSSIWFSECINRLCFLVHPFIPHAMTLQSLIGFRFPRQSWNKNYFLTATYWSLIFIFLNKGQFQIR